MKCSDLIEAWIVEGTVPCTHDRSNSCYGRKDRLRSRSKLLIKSQKTNISKTEQENTQTEKLTEEQRTLNKTHLLLLVHVLMNTRFIKARYKITFAYLC